MHAIAAIKAGLTMEGLEEALQMLYFESRKN